MAIPGVLARVRRKLESLRYPQLFIVAAVLFLITLVVPDPIPLIDEALLLVVTVALGRLTRPRTRDIGTDGERRQ